MFGMLKTAIKLVLLAIVVIAILAWAPWLDDQEVRNYYVATMHGYPEIRPFEVALGVSSLSPTPDVLDVQWIPFAKIVKLKSDSRFTPGTRNCIMTFWKGFYCVP